MRICTIGYEGAEIEPFIDTLEEAGVTHLVDVRELPASRRPYFSKNSLREQLESAGLKYSHFKALGDPKEGRDAMRRGDRQTFEEIYAKRIATEEAQEALAQVADIAEEEAIVLLCYERDPKTCHRTIVATKLAKLTSLEIQHLGVNPKRRRSNKAKDAGEYQPSI